MNTALIELRIRTLGQLFESMDPAPFRDKALDEKAARYLLDAVREHPRDTALRVLLHLPESLRQSAHHVPEAIRNHFQFAVAQAVRERRWHMAAGWRALLLGVLVLSVCITLGTVIAGQLADSSRAGLKVIDEGLLILGWVALWRPLDILLFDRLEMSKALAELRRLTDVPVELRFEEQVAATGDL